MAEEVTLKEQDEQENLDKEENLELTIPPGTIPPELEEENTFQKVEEQPQEAQKEEKVKFFDKKFLIIISALGTLVLILLIVLILLMVFKKDKTEISMNETLQEDNSSMEITKIKQTTLDAIIQKANVLYEKGDVKKALELYDNINIFNESLSSYNLGVVQMKQQDYAKAIMNFKQSLELEEHKVAAAINIAVCYFYLKDKEKFNYYLDLAKVHLPQNSNSILYNYYLGLINYYQSLYPEALQMFVHSNNLADYTDESLYLGAKIYSVLEANRDAINFLHKQENYEASLPLGLLYAKIGEYTKAKEYLNKATKIDSQYLRSTIALALVELKTGQYDKSAQIFKRLFAKDKDVASKYYGIKTRLKKNLYSIDIAQQNFAKKLISGKQQIYDLLFYFSPYRVFDVKQSMELITKADLGNFIQAYQYEDNLLTQSKTLSGINMQLSQAINLAFNFHLREANQKLQKLSQNYHSHDVIHYNLALTYAQLQDYNNAANHFSTAYHLNPKNHLAGIFAIFCMDLIKKDYSKFQNEVIENLQADNNIDQNTNIYKYLLHIPYNDYATMLPYLDNFEINKKSPLELMFVIIASNANNLINLRNQSVVALKDLLNKDIISNILFFNAKNIDLDIKTYAKQAQIYFQNTKLDYNSLFGGSGIVKDTFISLMQITGLINHVRNDIKKKLATSDKNSMGLIFALAYVDIFAKEYQEAYTLYNILIDDYKIKDSQTLFLAAVSAIGSNNPNSAIALLELAKLENEETLEARLALGLLYHEMKNLEPAIFQYEKVGDNFESKFFTFDIKN
ncbi:tetratricopeptide repeat protein [Campylobacter insulaenigrae]|uniref:tetratricopeptide repeat protein n=1 Tax=Campylobacter insulaenigrae TaxID=260714 RepID=UPI002152419B|nr:tetratricopeptide repeat protein [Campylobacter insulaenigrae]MCR6572544.1 tetratricopeptide repeat protein [Campylobacter insulaenigrae]MCR6581420.1 tetratricopeptide repeat protein [Campylobacter insulaenigrae]